MHTSVYLFGLALLPLIAAADPLLMHNDPDKAQAPVNRLSAYGILESWLVVGGFPNRPLTPAEAGPYTREGYQRDFLAPLGGEAQAVLTPGMTVPLDGAGEGQVATVMPATAGLNGRLDFRKYFPVTDDRVAYAFCDVEHDRAEWVECDFGSDDSARVWVNGALVHEIWTPARGCTPGSEHFRCRLQPGRNRILVKVENYRGNWEFFLSMSTPAMAAEVKHNIALATSMIGQPPLAGAAQRPFISRFGQYLHAEWPGKITALDELAQQREAEAAVLRADPGPRGWTAYGGWQDGPTLTATGFFHPERYQGKWWLVDPLGKLFFSHGIDCVTFGEQTGIDDREDWFAELPPADGDFADCYRTARGLHGYYAGKSTRTFDFSRANLHHKYGAAWREAFIARVPQRLRHWGMNTLGCWSDETIYLQRATPYTVYLNSGGVRLAGSGGHWGQFPDVFDPSFRASLDKRMGQEVGKSAGDAWCLGYFIDNELSWGEADALALATLRSPSTQAAKRAFLDRLRAKYATIERLNAAWGTAHASWEALGEHTGAPDRQRAAEDLLAFGRVFAETYFRTCREAIKAVAPQQLYLGCRFAHTHASHAMPAAVAAQYCDVVSYNLYELDLGAITFPDTTDVPVLVGEFHFGALDRGLFHTGLRSVASQADRAATYRRYLHSALAHPQIVGCHWFQFRDSPTSGRVIDGENYQIGFVNVCDTPYAETVQAAREIGDELYRYRLE